ncbi:Uu.00g065480.m01.CDS01 [Anthostomella pinea]|uniref:Uu.00g065480.m01.CDS01 n=1 Tax=Anthostomella pinea TaxID=933095 RepID=A0AAI8YN61_9PEZI|nr:Uu.00g065480.m01.CDS01 [Anthostomella pinea]
MVSNSLFATSLGHVVSQQDEVTDSNAGAKPDYSWVAEHYPVPTHQDLVGQIDAFLATPRPQRPPRETLWIFNFGYWDVWHLAALPRKLATAVLESEAHQLWSSIELLYQKAQDSESVAFSDYYLDTNLDPAATQSGAHPRAPFRILIPRFFDISLAPGFEAHRPEPPHPHTRAEQMRNAAFLTQFWDAIIVDLVDEWLDLPDPETWTDDDVVDIDVVNAVVAKRGETITAVERGGNSEGLLIPLPRREAMTYDMSRYLRELMVDRQLRDADLVDHNGLGTRPVDEGFAEVWQPCVQGEFALTNTDSVADGSDTAQKGELMDKEISAIDEELCAESREHLFWTGFTVNQRAINEIGKRAAAQFLRAARADAEWAMKSQLRLPPMHMDQEGRGYTAREFRA